MGGFPDSLSFGIADAIDAAVDYLANNLSWLFDAIVTGLSAMLNAAEWVLFFIPWWAILLLIAIGGYLATKKIVPSIIYGAMFFVIGLFGYWELMVYTWSIVLVAVLLSLLVGLPYGVLMSENERVRKASTMVLDAMQTMPSWVYLIPAVSFFGMGRVPAVLATMIYALPPVVRLTCHAILEVDRETVEAAQAFGSTKFQALFQVKIPQAAATIMAGINQTTMMAVAIVVTASMIGARSLGTEVLLAINRLEVGRGFEAGISIVFIAIVIDRISQGAAKSFQRRCGKEG